MTRKELKFKAKDALGLKIFGNLWLLALLAGLIFSAITTAAGSIIPGIGALLIVGPMTYGLQYAFLKNARDGQKMEMGDLFKGFSDDFSTTFLIGLLTTIFTFLWSLLLIVPGIVKSYAYSMAYYIKIDHPEYGWKQCVVASQQMMKGHKMEKFILDLSFIGWYIVGALCLGVGTLWVNPYVYATEAQFYESIKGEAPLIENM